MNIYYMNIYIIFERPFKFETENKTVKFTEKFSTFSNFSEFRFQSDNSRSIFVFNFCLVVL